MRASPRRLYGSVQRCGWRGAFVAFSLQENMIQLGLNHSYI
jgi:hypothetical protein